MIIVDHLGRYTVASRLNNHKPEHAVDVWYEMWAQHLGKPRKLIADRGPAFIGGAWGEVCDLLNIQMILISKGCAHENGTAERSVG